MLIAVLVCLVVWMFTSPAFSATISIDATLVSDCTTGNYNKSVRACTGSDGNAYNTTAEGVAQLNAGDILEIRGGTYNERIDLYAPTKKAGTAISPITIRGAAGETVIYQLNNGLAGSAGTPLVLAESSYVVIQDLIFDNTTVLQDTGIYPNFGAHHLTFQRITIRNGKNSLFSIDGNVHDIVVEDSNFHDAVSPTCAGGSRYYGMYLRSGSNITVRRNKIYQNPGGGIQVYPGPFTNVSITNNQIYENGSCDGTTVGGIIVLANPTIGGVINGVTIADNYIARNGIAGAGGPGTTGNTGGKSGGGITLSASASNALLNVKIYNNTITENEWTTSGGNARGLTIATTLVSNVDVKNNVLLVNESGAYTGGSGTILSHNACAAAESCGTTGKVSVSALTDVLISATDLRLKVGTNALRNAGTSVSTRPNPVGAADIGAFEQGLVSSAIVASGFIEVTINVMVAPVLPTTGCTGITIVNGTSTGTPVVDSCVGKAGSSNVMQLTISGFTASGTCTISYSPGTLTDSGYVGPTGAGLAQGINSASGVSVTGTCQNTPGGAPPSGLYSKFNLDEGSGTVANDSSGNLNHGTVTTGVTWVNNTSGTGVMIPTDDVTYRHVASTYGAAVNPTTESVSYCLLVLPDTQYAQKIIGSTGGNGNSQRGYVGWGTVNGVKQWGIGIQGSGFTSGPTEFPVQAQLTLVCLRFNSATDTANLSVNRTIGTSAAANKTYTSYTFVDNIRAGNDGTFTVNTGGATTYGMWIWNNKYLSDAEVEALYDTLFPQGSGVMCYKQQDFQAQLVYLDGSNNPINYLAPSAASIPAVAGGAVAVVVQVDCVGSAGDPLAMQFYYAKNGGVFSLAVPDAFGEGGIAMWGDDTDTRLNRNNLTACVSGALTPNYGPTQLVRGATPTIGLAQDNRYCLRAIIKFDASQAGNYFQLRLVQDNGAVLAGGYTATPRFDIIPPQASGGF